MAGIFHDNPDEDVRALTGLSKGIAQWCGQRDIQGNHGFRVVPLSSKIRECCEVGSILLNDRFPQPPGAFKRLGVLIAVGQMWPFFELNPRPSGRYSLWTARVLSLFIPTALGILEVNTSRSGAANWVKTNQWHGFASQHVGIEFLELLSWYDNRGWSPPLQLKDYEQMRLTQLALSISLIIETSYYCGELFSELDSDKRIRGKGPCLSALKQDLTSLSFISALKDANQK